MLRFDRMHSSDVHDGCVVFRLLSTDSQKYEFEVTATLAGLMAAAIQGASTRLPEYTGPSIVPLGFQPAIGPDIEPSLLLELGGNLTIGISLPPQKLADLKAALASLEASSTPGVGRH